MSDKKAVMCRDVKIGGGAPISIQSMTNTPTADVKATMEQIRRLEEAGCQIVRMAVPDMEAAQALYEIRKQTDLPLVADIHFDHRLALKAIRAGMDKIRINPGNIGSEDKVKEVVDLAKDYHIPIRVGVNSGSLEKDILQRYGKVTAEGLAESALRNVALLEKYDFDDIVISLKSSNVKMTKAMAWMTGNMKMSMDDSDQTAADIITRGCDMGTKTLYKYMNQYDHADLSVRDTARKLIAAEEDLEKQLHPFL